MRTYLRFVFLFVAVSFSLSMDVSAMTMSGKVSTDTKLSGDVLISGDLVIEKDVTLEIGPGTNITLSGGSIDVYGTVIANGTKESPISFNGRQTDNNQLNGIRIINSNKKSSEISYASFTRLSTALQVINSLVSVTDSTFNNNKIAIDTKQKDKTLIKNNVIESNRKVGIFCKSGSNATIIGNKISGIKKFGIYIHRSGGVTVSGNEVSGCGSALMVGYVDSDPQVSGNKFSSNKIGIQVEKGANPVIQGNTINNNKYGISVSKRSDPVITSNDIERNKVGIFITYSSYPIIEKNNLIDNEHSVYLEFQSAQWERQRGDSVERGGKKYPGGKMPAGAFSGGGASSEFVAPKKNLSDKVSARNNFWGDDVTGEFESGAKNISAIYDYYDAMEFLDNGRKYKLDSVDYSSWSNTKF